MAILKRKFIRYPNEREAWGEYGTPSEESIKNHIRDFHEYLVNDLGLIQTEDQGQLDLDNIPDLDLKTKYDQSTTSRWTSWSYGYLMYQFTDARQTEYPIYLRFQFNMVDGSYTSNTYYRSRTYLNVRFNVMTSTDGSGSGSPQATNLAFDLTPFYSHSSNNSNRFTQNQSDSFGFFDSENGRLFLTICPGMYKGTSDYTYTSNSPQICLYIERCLPSSSVEVDNYFLVQVYNRGLWDTSETYRRMNTYFCTYDNIIYNHYLTSYIPMEGLVPNTSTRYNIFRTINVNPRSLEMSTNLNMLSYSNNEIPLLGVEVEVRISETETAKYITVSPSQTSTYVYTTNYGHLIRID